MERLVQPKSLFRFRCLKVRFQSGIPTPPKNLLGKDRCTLHNTFLEMRTGELCSSLWPLPTSPRSWGATGAQEPSPYLGSAGNAYLAQGCPTVQCVWRQPEQYRCYYPVV